MLARNAKVKTDWNRKFLIAENISQPNQLGCYLYRTAISRKQADFERIGQYSQLPLHYFQPAYPAAHIEITSIPWHYIQR